MQERMRKEQSRPEIPEVNQVVECVFLCVVPDGQKGAHNQNIDQTDQQHDRGAGEKDCGQLCREVPLFSARETMFFRYPDLRSVWKDHAYGSAAPTGIR